MAREDSDSMFTPADAEAAKRVQRLRELGLGDRPEPEFDEFARRLAESAGAPLAMVNFIGDNKQYFAGLHAPSMATPDETGTVSANDPARTMRKDQGWCPHVVSRKLPLVLDDVCDYPRFAGNPVVDEVGIRSYIGAPLIDEETGTAIGTVCIVDLEPRPWGRPGLDFIKEKAAELMQIIRERDE